MKRRFQPVTSEGAVIFAIIMLAAGAALADDPKEIVRLSIEKDQNNRAMRQHYTYIQRSVEKQFDKNGNVKSTVSTAHDISILYGHRFSRLIEKDGHPLNAAEEQKEKQRLEKFTNLWTHETAAEREKREARQRASRQKEQAWMREIPDGYDLKLIGEEKIAGQDCWMIQAEPHPGYKPKHDEAKYFAKIRGKLWISKAEYQWVKADAETIDTISFGLVLFRLYKGARLQFEQTRVNDEVWLPKTEHVNAGARLGIFVKTSIEQINTYENYRKFQTDSKVVGTDEVKQ